MPSYNCKHPTCNVLLAARGYCSAHQRTAGGAQADYDRYQRDPWSRRFYNSARWIRTRRAYICRHPMCEKCGKALAEHVHHKKRVHEVRSNSPHLLYATENLMSLCVPCHNTVDKTVVVAC